MSQTTTLTDLRGLSRLSGRLLLALAAMSLFAVGACADMPGQDTIRDDDPGRWDFVQGNVTWEIEHTTCPSTVTAAGTNGWGEWGEVSVEDGTTYVVFPSLPLLSGQDQAGSADVEGTTIFMSQTDGAAVNCDVTGNVSIGDGLATGETTEILTSVGDINCTTRGRFVVEHDDGPPPGFWNALDGSGD